MGFKPMLTINIFQLMKYQKASQIQALMGFKPKAKYFAASEIAKKKAYKILKERAYEISKESLQHSGFYGIQTHDLYDKTLSNLWNTKTESLKNLG